jgi:replicative DNA helicase
MSAQPAQPRRRQRDWSTIEPIPVDGVAPPFDERAEFLAVEAALASPGFLERVSPPLTHEHFFAGRCRTAFEAIVAVTTEAGAADAVSVLEWLRAHDRLTGFDLSVLESRPEFSATELAKAVSAARLVFELGEERALALHCQRATAAIYTRSFESRRQFFEAFEAKASQICRAATRATETVSAQQAVDKAIRDLGARADDMGVSSGIAAYDRAAGTLRAGQYTVIGGSTGNGKSTWGLTVAGNVAVRGGGVLYAATADMTAEELSLKLACSWAGISVKKMLDGQGSADDHARLLTARKRFDRLPLEYDICHGKSVQEIDAQVRRTRAAFARKSVRMRLLVVDYVQRATYLQPQRGWNEEQTLYAISEHLKAIASRHDIHVLGLVQTKRPPPPSKKGEAEAKPSLDDIERCKAIAKPAEIVGFIHRFRDDRGKYPARGQAEIVLGKARWRPGTEVPVILDARLGRFEDDPDAPRQEDD